jgi:hypothetical protein
MRSLPLNLGLFRGDLELPGFKDPAHVSRRRRAIIFRLVALCIRAASVGGLFVLSVKKRFLPHLLWFWGRHIGAFRHER